METKVRDANAKIQKRPSAVEGKPPAKSAKTGSQQACLTDFKFVKKVSIELGDGRIDKDQISIVCWNVNGIKGMISKGILQEQVSNLQPDIICFNETKIGARQSSN